MQADSQPVAGGELMSEADRLTDEAIELVIRLQNDPDNPVVDDVIRLWRARSAAHEQAWTRVARIHGASGKILAEQRRAARRARSGLTRRNLVVGGLLAAGAGATGSLIVPGMIARAWADVATGTAETRNVALPDGTTATLGPDSALAFAFSPERRGVELLSGMAFFDVARDAERPFRVAAGAVTASARDTAFEAGLEAGIFSVAVDRGTLAVSTAAAPADQLTAGEWMSFGPDGSGPERGTRDVSQIAAWRDNLVIAQREVATALIARIARWIPGRVLVADPFIGQERISGIFDLNDPVRALEAAVQPTGARVRQIASVLTVVSYF